MPSTKSFDTYLQKRLSKADILSIEKAAQAECLAYTQFTADFNTEPELSAFAEKCAAVLTSPFVCYLHGPLGAGKTTFVRAFLRAVGITGAIKSPTFSLIETYAVEGKTFLHGDLYRITDPEEVAYLDIPNYLDETSIAFIEWADNGKNHLPLPDADCYIEPQGEGRKVMIIAKSERAMRFFEKLRI